MSDCIKLYAIYDKRSKRFGSFMFSDNKESVIRQFLQVVSNTPFYPDFSLYMILSVYPNTELVDDEVVNHADALVDWDGTIEDITPSDAEIQFFREQVLKFEQLLNKR